MRTQLLLSALMAMLLVGCSDNTTTRRYNISVKNETSAPVTIWLTKDGGPVEPAWSSPEQLAITKPAYDETIGGVTVPAGKTADTGTIEGKFRPGAYAWLRVYEGQRTFSEILAISRGNPARTDVPLSPGKNDIVVKKVAGQFVAVGTRESDRAPAAGK